MREYRLFDESLRDIVDLRNYADIIIDAIHQVDATFDVEVYANRCVVKSDVSQGQSVKIGRILEKSTLKDYGVMTAFRLFEGKKMSLQQSHNERNNKQKKAIGDRP